MKRPEFVTKALKHFHEVFHGIHHTEWETLKSYIVSLEKAAEWQPIDENTPLYPLLLWRSDRNTQEIGTVDSQWIGNPQYAYTMWRELPNPPTKE